METWWEIRQGTVHCRNGTTILVQSMDSRRRRSDGLEERRVILYYFTIQLPRLWFESQRLWVNYNVLGCWHKSYPIFADRSSWFFSQIGLDFKSNQAAKGAPPWNRSSLATPWRRFMMAWLIGDNLFPFQISELARYPRSIFRTSVFLLLKLGRGQAVHPN